MLAVFEPRRRKACNQGLIKYHKKMKKFLILAFVSAAMLLNTSCKKEVELTGTTWTASYSETMEEEGITGTIIATITLAFKTETAGEMLTAATISALGQTFDTGTETSQFTYTFDGESAGTLTAVIDEQTGETDTINFTYNKDDKTITISENTADSNMTLVFTQNAK